MGPARDDADDLTLSGLGGVLLNAETVERMLGIMADLTQRTVPGALAVSVTLPDPSGPFTPNASGPLARELDDVQYATGTGPCLTAIDSAERVESSIADALERWPAFAAAAEQRSVGGVYSAPLMLTDRPVGALNVYLTSAEPLSKEGADMATLLAEQGAAVVSCALAYNEVSALAEQLEEALASRDLIGQAKGILMQAEGCDANAAFDLLRRASQRTNRKLRDVAVDLVASTTGREEG